ncbi:MAG: hypothetical protein LRY71_19185 [Bacillaceae bacterium]|nr:hypothetical protein [Bacillaceae bacterium]
MTQTDTYVYGSGEWFSDTKGLVFKNFSVGSYKKEYEERTYVGVDFGFTHPTVLLEIGFKDNDIYIYREFYQSNKTIIENIKMLESENWDKSLPHIADSASPEQTKEMKQAGFRISPVNKDMVMDGIAWLQNRRIFIDESCKNFIAEISSYSWLQGDGAYKENLPQSGDDGIAALRYGSRRFRQQRKVRTLERSIIGIY